MRSTVALWALFAVTGCASAAGTDPKPPDVQADAGVDSSAADGSVEAGESADVAAPAGPLLLAPGQVAELPMADGLAGVRLATPLGDEKFVVILGSTRFDNPTLKFAYTLTLGDAPSATSAPAPISGCSLSNQPWHDTPLAIEPAPQGTAPAIGTLRDLKMSSGAGVETISAKVVAVGARAVVWADVSPGHPAELDPAFVTEFLTDFDALILPRERTVFGTESDLDKDGRISLVFTPLTYKTAVAFFTGCDLKQLAGCGAGNQGEFLYLTPPAAIKPPYNTAAAMKEILAHELGHLIHFNRTVLRNNLTEWHDSSYMIEGFGALAQDTIGFQSGNLYVTLAGLDKINDFSLGDTLRDNTAYDTKRDGALRGGSYLFVRWLYDRGGGDLANADGSIGNLGGPAFIRALLDDKLGVGAALPALGKAKIDDIGMDFFTTLAVSNRENVGGVVATNPCFRYLPSLIDPVTKKQRGADVFATFHGQTMQGPKLQDAAKADKSLRGGGVDYLVLEADAAAAELAFTLQVPVKANARVRVARIR